MRTTTLARKLFQSVHESMARKSAYQRLREYQRYVDVKYETDDFLVTTAKSGREVTKVLELRHEVFVKEWQGRSHVSGLDMDELDLVADHLMIIDKSKNEIVGTYRLISSKLTHSFYSETEFDIGRFLKTPEAKLELGRACVRAEYRDGNTLDLLWKGLARYIFATGTDILFGCASVKSTEATDVSDLLSHLQALGKWNDDFAIRPTEQYRFDRFSLSDQGTMSRDGLKKILPPLLRSYLHAGATVHGWPAFDDEFACTDVFTVLDWRQLDDKFRMRFVKS